MYFKGSRGEVLLVLSVEESRELVVDHGENELVYPNVNTIDCLEQIAAARADALRLVGDDEQRAVEVNDAAFRLPLQEMAALDFVTWDRYAGTPDDFVVFGWIARAQDGRSDFVTFNVVPEGIGFSTSSAEWSAEISRRLNGNADTHNHCRRVESHPAAAELSNVVRLGTCSWGSSGVWTVVQTSTVVLPHPADVASGERPACAANAGGPHCPCCDHEAPCCNCGERLQLAEVPAGS